MKTLIITVGTRQVGWRCKDGIVRCLGVDGSKGIPSHISELYDELGIARGNHQDIESDRPHSWSVWDLGQRLLEYCQQGGFQAVELLLDRQIIADQVNQGLEHVLLWGTQQPENVSWQYRRLDTLWLAELMAGKLRESYPHLQVKVFSPKISAIDSDAIREELETHILPFALETRDLQDEEFTLLIANKGATPAIAEGLSICAGALVRDCQVVNITPIEPRPAFRQVNDTAQEACSASEYRELNLSSYFWPLERSRIISAWERGDFREAQIWLSSHRARHKPLYELAENLVLTTNWQIEEALKKLKNWIGTKAVKRKICVDTYPDWQQQLEQLCLQGNKATTDSKFLKIWESCFLIQLELERQHATTAFIHFSQTLERLLFLRYQSEDWISQGYIVPPEDQQDRGLRYKASLGELRVAWQKIQKLDDEAEVLQQLQRINELRNSVVHKGEPLTFTKLAKELFPALQNPDVETIYGEMEKLLRQICNPSWSIPEEPLLRSLYQWGLETLKN